MPMIYKVICDDEDCCIEASSVVGSEAEAENVAERAGFWYAGNGKWFCPGCKAEPERAAAKAAKEGP